MYRFLLALVCAAVVWLVPSIVHADKTTNILWLATWPWSGDPKSPIAIAKPYRIGPYLDREARERACVAAKLPKYCSQIGFGATEHEPCAAVGVYVYFDQQDQINFAFAESGGKTAAEAAYGVDKHLEFVQKHYGWKQPRLLASESACLPDS